MNMINNMGIRSSASETTLENKHRFCAIRSQDTNNSASSLRWSRSSGMPGRRLRGLVERRWGRTLACHWLTTGKSLASCCSEKASPELTDRPSSLCRHNSKDLGSGCNSRLSKSRTIRQDLPECRGGWGGWSWRW